MSEYFVGSTGVNNQTNFSSLSTSEVLDDLSLNTSDSPTFAGLDIESSGSTSAKVDLVGTYTTWSLENQYVNGATNDMFRIYNSQLGADSLTIHRLNNNVGIGTPTPTAKLHISENSGQVRIGSPTTSYGGVGFAGSLTAANAALWGTATTTIIGAAGGGSIEMKLGNDAGGNGSLKMEADKLYYTGGNLGIGTTNPLRGNLVVKGDFQTIASGNGQLAVISKVSGSNPAAKDIGGQMVFGGPISASDSNRTFGLVGGYKENNTSGDRAGYLTFGTRQNAGSRDIFERMRIDSIGNVGIGSTTPENKLHILTSTTDTSSQLMVQNGSSGDAAIKFNISGQSYVIGIDNSDANKFKISGHASLGTYDRLTIDTSGNATFTGKVTSSTTVSNDAAATLTTKGYVDAAIAGGVSGSFLPLAGGTMTGNTLHGDNIASYWGSGNDLRVQHSGSSGSIYNITGDLNIINDATDSDINFKSDDGSGGITTYLQLDGGGVLTRAYKNFRAQDAVRLQAGSSGDFSILHNGADSYLENDTGDLYIRNNADDKDIIFQSDNGTGGVGEYFRLDGSQSDSGSDYRYTRWQDFSVVALGSNNDLQLWHDGTNSRIENNTGNLILTNNTNDGDIIFKSDDGSGGVTPYLRLDGSHTQMLATKNLHFDDNVKALFGDYSSPDLQIYHDGSNSFIKDTGTGSLYIDGSQNVFIRDTNGQVWFQGNAGGVNLRYQDSVKIQTTSSGVSVTGSMVANAAVVNQVTAATSSGSIKFKNNSGSDKAIILDNGNFGIGTASPSYPLEISNSGTVPIAYERTGTSAKKWGFHIDSANTYWQNITDGVMGLTVSNAGRIGIGTLSPESKLHVIDSNSSTQLRLNQSGDNDAVLGSGTNFFAIKTGTGGNTNALSILHSNQNVGIGTGATAPADKLTIQEDSADFSIRKTDGTLSTRIVQFGSGASEIRQYDASGSQKVSINTVGNSYFNGGNVGIGTDSPSRKFEIHENTTNLTIGEKSGYTPSVYGPVIETNANAITLPRDLYLAGSQANVRNISSVLTLNGDNGIAFRYYDGSSGQEGMRLTNSGNVGIGTTTPAQKLEVSGRIKSSDGLLSNGFNVYAGSATTGFLIELDVASNNYAHIHGALKLQQFNVSSQQIINFSATTLNNGTVQSSAATADIDVTIKLFVYNSKWYIHVPSPSTYTDISAYVHLGAGYQGSSRASNCIINVTSAAVPSSGVSGSVDIVAQKRILANTSGNVGIGTASPAGELEVQGTGDLLFLRETGREAVTITGQGNGSGSQMIFKTHSGSSLAEAMRILPSGNVGIGTTSSVAKLQIQSVSTSTDSNTLRITHSRSDADVQTHAAFIDMNLSGADNTTTDRTNTGLKIDLDSSANGDASNEHRIYGVSTDVRFTGFSDIARGGDFYAESNYTGAKTNQLIGVYGSAAHDANSTSGGVTNMYGVYGVSSPQDLGDVDNAFGGHFRVTIPTSRTANVGVTKGVEGEIQIDKDTAIDYDTMIGVSSIIDNNEGSVPNFGNQYLFKGDYQGTKGSNAYGIFVEGDKNYFEGSVGIGTASPAHKLHVDGDTAIKESELQITSSSSAYTTHFNYQDGGSNTISQASGASTIFRESSSTLVTISNGTYKLDVAGAIRANGNIVTTSASQIMASRKFSALNTSGVMLTDSGASNGLSIANGGNATFTHNLTVSGDLTVNGTTTTINSTTVQVDDKNIELGTVATPTDTTADGGGITLKGATDKTINWINSTDSWTFSERIAIFPDGSASLPALTLGNDNDTGIYRFASGSDVYIGFSTAGTGRGHFGPAGITSNQNLYSASGGEFRNFGGTWRGTTGQTGNGFQFINSVDGTALTISSTGDTVASGSVTATGLDINGAADISGNLEVGEYILRSGQGSNYHRFLASRQIFVVGNASSIDLNNGTSTFGATGGATTLQGSSLLLDSAADITIDAGGQDIILSDDGTIFGTLSNSSGFQIRSRVNNADILFRGVDDGTEFTALTLDMSAGGNATFAGAVTIANLSASQTAPTTQLLFDNNNIDDGGGYNIDFKSSSNDTANRFMARIQALRGSGAISSLGFFTETGSALTRALLLDSSQNATFAGDVKADTHFTSSDTNVTLSTNSNGTVFLRPNGKGSTTSQSTFTTTLATIGTNATFAGDVSADNITSTSNGGSASIYINSTRPTLGFTDSNSFTDANDIYIVRGSSGNKLQFQWYDNSASSTTETFSIDNSGNATFAGDVSLGTSKRLYLSGTSVELLHDGSNAIFINNTGDFKIQNAATDKDIIFRGKDGSSTINALTLDMSDAGTAIFNHDILPATNLGSDLGSSSKRFQSVFCQGLSAASDVTTPTIQLQGNLKILNKAQTGYLDLATRNTTDTEVKYDLNNVGSLNFPSGTLLKTTSGNQYLQLRYGSTGAGGIQVRDGDNALQGYLYADGSSTPSFGLLHGGGSWAVLCRTNSYVQIRHNNSTKFQTQDWGLSFTGNTVASGNVYAGGANGFVFGSSTSEGEYIYRTGNDIRVFAGGDDRLAVDGDDGNVGINTNSPSYKLDVSGGIRAGGKVTYEKSAGSLDTTGYAVAGLVAGSNGMSAGFTFTCFGHLGDYQKIVYGCYNASGTWNTQKVINEGTNDFDVVASANGSTITFTFKSTSGTKSYTPRVSVEAFGSSINNTYA